MQTNIIDFINTNRDRYVDELKQWLAIPSISALPEHAADVRRAAEWAVAELTRVGLQNARLIDTPGNPVVCAEWLGAPGAPTILYLRALRRAAGRSARPVDHATLRADGARRRALRARCVRRQGAGVHALQGPRGAPEAERPAAGELQGDPRRARRRSAAPTWTTFIRANREALKADLVLISDTEMFDRGVPSLCYGLRGLAYFQIDVRGTKTDLHSGTFGGAVANPAMVLAQVLAQMKDRGGRIRIPGFYDDVRPLSDSERAEFKRLPFNETRYRKELGAPKLFGESGYTTLERTTARPTFEVNGLLSGFTGEGAKTVLPAVAMAKVSMRLVPDQAPEKVGELFEAYLKKVMPKTVEWKLTKMHGGMPWMASLDNEYVQAAGRAIEKGFGKVPVFTREGGSIPVVATFQKELGVPSVLFGVGLPDDRIHAPNEKIDLSNFHNGVIASAVLYEEIAALKS